MIRKGIRGKSRILLTGLLLFAMIFPTFSVRADGDADKVYKYNSNNQFGKFSDYIKEAGDKTEIEMQTDVSDAGNVDITPNFKRWFSSKKGWISGGIEMVRVGWIAENTITFKSGTDITVENINFYKLRQEGAKVVIEKGATVRFKNVDFSNTLENNGKAIFENVKFVTGEIKDNGTSEYIGTEKPKNIGTPASTAEFMPLSMGLSTETLDPRVKGKSFENLVNVTFGGTKKEEATKKVEVSPSDAGVKAEWTDEGIKISGSPSQATTYTIKASLESTKEDGSKDLVEKEITLKVNEEIEVKLDGKLLDLAVGQEISSVDAVSSASSGGRISSSNKALEILVKEGQGEWQKYKDFAVKNPDTKLSFKFNPDTNELRAVELIGTVALSGKLSKPGQYSVSAFVSQGGREAESNAVSFNVFDLNVSFKERLAELKPDLQYWMMAPWKMQNTSGGATIPNHLKKIYGSNESGLYGQIGNNKSTATDVIVIPAGADLTFVNMKILSSVKLVVEKGAKLTLDDSVSYGPIEVNGGTFSMKNSGSLVSSLTLNDGSSLEDAEIKSYANSLTDGNYTNPYPASVVTVNGNVSFKGKNIIKGSYGDASKIGQVALTVNGSVSLEEGGILTAIGGGDPLLPYALQGGHGIKLNGGKISGKAIINAKGGNSATSQAKGGSGIAGSGEIDVDEINAVGGNGFGNVILSGKGAGGDSIEKTVKFKAKKLSAVGGKGEPEGLSWKEAPVDEKKPGQDPKIQDPEEGKPKEEKPVVPKNEEDKYTYALIKAILSDKVKLSEKFDFEKSEDGSLTFVFDGPFEKFSKLMLNGKELKADEYKVVAGSTKITLSKDFLAEIKAGEYELTAVYNNGKESKVKFELIGKTEKSSVEKSADKSENTSKTSGNTPMVKAGNSPRTGEFMSPVFSMGLALLAGLGYFAIRKKSRY
ncbi:hypothetical protein ACQRBF_01200 [Peptoniphilaceae bacterium SGI.131]